MKYAFFIEPGKELAEFILEWKANIADIVPSSPFCSHPPHCTLYIASLSEPTLWEKSIERQLSRLSPFMCSTADMVAFYNDPQAGGAHTVACRADNNEQLMRVQLTIAEDLGRFVTGSPGRVEYTNEVFESSYLRYGFAFAGSHWIPHFTIAGLHTGRNDPLLLQLLAQKPVYSFNVDHIGLWSVENESHLHLRDFKLKG